MKILHVIMPVGLGGVEKLVSNLFENINEYGEEMYIAISDKYEKKFIDHYKIKNVNRILTIKTNNMLEVIISLKKIINCINPDIIHTHARRECVMCALLKGKKFHIRTQHMEENPRLRVTFIEKYLLKNKVDLWIATSKMLSEKYLKKLNYIENKKITNIYNGIKKRQDSTEEILPKLSFCVLSRITYQKGIDILLNSINNMDIKNRIFIDIYGDGDEKQNLMEMVKKMKLQNNIIFFPATDCPIKKIKEHAILLMPSRYEGLPLTILEAMSEGVPVAVHDVGCVKEFINSGENGWIINENLSWEKFFEYILDNKYDMEKISDNARKTYLHLFTDKKMAKYYLSEYKKIVKV